ncbi:hypothetical protein Tco_1538595 [Tanacetum coccineum]
MVTFGSKPSLVCSRILSSGQSPSIPMSLIVVLVVAVVVPVISLVVVVATLIVVVATLIVVALPLSLVVISNSFSFGFVTSCFHMYEQFGYEPFGELLTALIKKTVWKNGCVLQGESARIAYSISWVPITQGERIYQLDADRGWVRKLYMAYTERTSYKQINHYAEATGAHITQLTAEMARLINTTFHDWDLTSRPQANANKSNAVPIKRADRTRTEAIKEGLREAKKSWKADDVNGSSIWGVRRPESGLFTAVGQTNMTYAHMRSWSMSAIANLFGHESINHEENSMSLVSSSIIARHFYGTALTIHGIIVSRNDGDNDWNNESSGLAHQHAHWSL